MYTDQQIRQKAYQLSNAGAPSSEIEKFVKLAKMEQTGGQQTSSEDSFFSRVASKVGSVASEAAGKIGDTFKKTAAGDINPAETGIRTVGALAGGIGDLAGSAALGIGKALLPKAAEEAIAGSFKKAISESDIPKIMESYGAWKERNPRGAEDLESIVDIASLLPVGKGTQVAGKTAAEAVGTAAKATGSVAAGAGRLAKETGELAVQKVITPSVREAERMLAYEANTPFLTRVYNAAVGKADTMKPVTRATTATKKGVQGTERMVGVQAKREADKLWKTQIEPSVNASDAIVSKDDLFAPIVERISATSEPGRRAALQDAFDAIKSDYKAVESFTLKDAQKVKRELDEFTPDKIFKGKSVANEYATLKNDMANAIRQKTYDALADQNIKQAYLDWGNLSELQKIGVKAISGAGKKGGFGTFWSSMWDSLVTPVGTIGGRQVYRVGDLMEFVGDKGIKKFGEFLQSKGFHRK